MPTIRTLATLPFAAAVLLLARPVAAEEGRERAKGPANEPQAAGPQHPTPAPGPGERMPGPPQVPPPRFNDGRFEGPGPRFPNRPPLGRGDGGMGAGMPQPGSMGMGGPPMNMPGVMPPSGPFGGRDPRELEELKRIDPELYELEKSDQDLERQTFGLAQQLRRAPPDQQEKIRQQIPELVAKQFEVRQSRRELHLKRLQEELEELRQAILRRNEMRDEIIARRINELIGAQSDLDF